MKLWKRMLAYPASYLLVMIIGAFLGWDQVVCQNIIIMAMGLTIIWKLEALCPIKEEKIND